MAFRVLLLLLALTLNACAVSGLLPDWSSEDVAGPEPAYRFLIANRLSEVVGSPASAGTLEISDARRVDSLKGASWQVCVKAQKFPFPPRYYAVFFQREQIVQSRLSVLIDHCELQKFKSFDWKMEANNPPMTNPSVANPPTMDPSTGDPLSPLPQPR
jgi:hypothetical protein